SREIAFLFAWQVVQTFPSFSLFCRPRATAPPNIKYCVINNSIKNVLDVYNHPAYTQLNSMNYIKATYLKLLI
ncbi:hypothetical protein, partial [Chromobacterium amazonense]